MLFELIKKRTIFKISIFLIFLVSTLFALDQESEESKQFELDNGLRIFLYKRNTLPLLNVSVSVNLGSKDETEDTNGLVHILEHCILFGGTSSRSSSEVSKDIRRHGAYFNAHTSRDLITFDISLPSEYADFAIQNQKEILFDLKLSQEEIDREKKVILEEIAQIKDDPIRYATTLVFQELYKNHPYTFPIYGKEEVIRTATSEQMEKFHKKYFVPSNCTLAVVGEFILGEMEEKIRNIFGDLKNEEFSPPEYNKSPLLEKTIEIEHEMDVNLGYLVIGISGPDYNHLDQYAVDVLVQILGRGVAPLLDSSLNSKRRLVYSSGMNYYAQKFGGAILILLTTEPKSIKTAKSEAIKFLKNVRKERFSKDDYSTGDQMYVLDFLESAKNQLRLNFHQGQEVGLDIANSLSRYLILNENSSGGNYLETINGLSSSDLRKVGGKYLSRGKYVVVSIVPKKE